MQVLVTPQSAEPLRHKATCYFALVRVILYVINCSSHLGSRNCSRIEAGEGEDIAKLRSNFAKLASPAALLTDTQAEEAHVLSDVIHSSSTRTFSLYFPDML